MTATAMAGLLGIDRALVGRMAQEGILPRGADGRFEPLATMSAYIKHLRARAKERSQSAAHSILQEARAEEIKLRTAERLNQLLPVEVVEGFVDFWLGPIKSELAGIPARVTRDVALRKMIERELDSMLHRLADRAERGAAMAERGIDPLEGEEKPRTNRRRTAKRSSNAQVKKD